MTAVFNPTLYEHYKGDFEKHLEEDKKVIDQKLKVLANLLIDMIIANHEAVRLKTKPKQAIINSDG